MPKEEVAMMEKIVAGISEVAGSHPAIAWAMQLAGERNAVVELVHVVDTMVMSILFKSISLDQCALSAK